MFIAVGKITRPHGTKGHVKVLTYADKPDRFEGIKTIFVETERGVERFLLENVQLHGEVPLIKLKRVDSRSEAQLLNGCEVLLPVEQQIELPPDTYFIHDMVGLKVFDNDGNSLGTLEEVMQSAGPDIYVVRKGEEEVLIPAVSEFVREINLDKGRMVISPIEGMFSDEN